MLLLGSGLSLGGGGGSRCGPEPCVGPGGSRRLGPWARALPQLLPYGLGRAKILTMGLRPSERPLCIRWAGGRLHSGPPISNGSQSCALVEDAPPAPPVPPGFTPPRQCRPPVAESVPLSREKEAQLAGCLLGLVLAAGLGLFLQKWWGPRVPGSPPHHPGCTH